MKHPNNSQSRTKTTGRKAQLPAKEINHRFLKAAKGYLASATKTELKQSLKAQGLAMNDSNIERLRELCIERVQIEKDCQTLRLCRRRGMTPEAVKAMNTRYAYVTTRKVLLNGKPYQLPQGTPQERLNTLRRKTIASEAKSIFRYGAAGGSSMRITYAMSAAEVRYEVIMDSNRNTYRGSFKNWLAREDHHHICVPADWRMRVERRGLANLAGLMTLDARQLECPDSIMLYAATWARQGRGFEVATERGFIAISQSAHFHAATAEAAVAGIRRKLKLRGSNAMQLSVDAFITRFAGVDCEVSIDDAQESGSCLYGILSWCEQVGIDPERKQVSLTEVLSGFRQLPQVEVRRAVLHAVRRQRKERQTKTHRQAG